MAELQEIWKDIEGWEGKYQVSSFGRIKSLRKNKILTEKICKGTGYSMIILYNKKYKKGYSIHRLVANAFIPNQNNYPCVNHKDETRTNNRVENLEWCTYKYNMNYGHCQEKIRKNFTKSEKYYAALTENRKKCRKPILQFTKDGVFVARHESIEAAARAIGAKNHHITDCAKGGRHKTSNGFVWKYERS